MAGNGILMLNPGYLRDNWNKTTGLAEYIAEIDVNALCREYEEIIGSAPRRSAREKRYFVGHSGVTSSGKWSNRKEEHYAVALCSLGLVWPQPGGGEFRLLDYQVPLKARQSDRGVGKIDLVGVTDRGRIMVIEVKVAPDRSGARGDTPVRALMEGLRYAAIAWANVDVIAAEAKNCFGTAIVKKPPVVQILADSAWWRGWLHMAGSTRKAAGDWEAPFARLIQAVEDRLGLAIQCLALEDASLTMGLEGRLPVLDREPAAHAVDFARRITGAKLRRQGSTMTERFLPGVPGPEIEAIFGAAPGNEIASGKFDSPESSAALAANAFGFFLGRPSDLPALPGCEGEAWPARSLTLEAEVRFPWSGGRHPVLDGLATTRSALIGIESKRFEPYRARKAPSLSEAYWRPEWGEFMNGYQSIRDGLSNEPKLYSHLDAAQLFKHAFALRTAVHRQGAYNGLTPVLYYVYAEPEVWPKDGKPVDDGAKTRHRQEIASFTAAVAGDEVIFISCPYRRLLDAWRRQNDGSIRVHADAVSERFSP